MSERAPTLPPAGIQSRAGSIIGSQGTEPGGKPERERGGEAEEVMAVGEQGETEG